MENKQGKIEKMPQPSFLFPFTTFLIALAILWGNVVARQGYGLACPDWPLCHGSLIPPMRVDVLVEYLHRLVALFLTLCAIASTMRIFRYYPPSYKKTISLALTLLFVQILLGGLTVLLKLPPIITIIHLANSLIIFMLFLYITLLSYRRSTILLKPSPLFLMPLFFVYVQSLLGAVMRHTYSGLACAQFPACNNGEWIPAALSNGEMIHLLHRLFGYIVFGVFCVYAALYWKHAHKKQAVILISFMFLQIFLGAASVLTHLSTVIVTLHLANALYIIAYLVIQSVKYSEQNLKSKEHYETKTIMA